MVMPTTHQLYDFGVGTVAVCSVLHTFLPPWDFLNEFPTAQKYYKVIVYLVGYIAINGRSTVYKQISVNNPTSPNANIPTLAHMANQVVNGKDNP